jgi:heparin/heparan-sulfate lyase
MIKKLLVSIIAAIGFAAVAENVIHYRQPSRLDAVDAVLNLDRVEIVDQPTFAKGKGVALKPGVESLTGSRTDHTPELTFAFQAEKPGRFRLTAHSAADEYGQSHMRTWRKEHATYQAKLRFDDELPTLRHAFSPWRDAGKNATTLGRFDLTGKPQKLTIQLPRGVRLEQLEFRLCVPPEAPEAMLSYQPEITPPANRHPRIWFNPASLEVTRRNLHKPEHRPLYEKIRASALAPYRGFDPGWEALADPKLEDVIVNQAFVSLMENDAVLGRQAVEHMKGYLGQVTFDNTGDITRIVGGTIYAAALVYDWCYAYLSPEERTYFREKMLSFAFDMEVGWPPARQTIVSGHGNEWQLCRDQLAMAIAIYDEDPTPYRYLAWHVFENLVPMRTFEYQSPRHNQGSNYGYLRYQSDLYTAWLFERMTGKHIFDENFFKVIDFWTYMRLPNGAMFPCGDGEIDFVYWKYPLTTMFAQAGRRSAQLKGEMIRQDSLNEFPLLALIFNDPDLRPDMSFDTLPLSIDFGPVLGGMVARTGWDLSDTSSDVIAEIKGGGYNFGNHQHSDAGAIQLYYRGRQIVDLGQYRFFGIPYDLGFAKRSVSHSMMLVTDPEETFFENFPNDGGIQLNRISPRSPQDVQSNPAFYRGKVCSAAFGPNRMKPFYSCFSVDLTGAYSAKIEKYVRSFVFHNLNTPDHPAVIVLYDYVRSARAEFRKELQFNTATVPLTTPDGFVSSNQTPAGTGDVHVQVLLPAADQRGMTVKSGDAALTVGDRTYGIRKPDHWAAKGARVQFSPNRPNRIDRFLTVIQPTPGQGEPHQVTFTEEADQITLYFADCVTVIHGDGGQFRRPVRVAIPADGVEANVTVTALAPGEWSDGESVFTVSSGNNTFFAVLKERRELTLTPIRLDR